MRSLPILDAAPAPSRRRLPEWLKRDLPVGNENGFTHHLLRELRLETVCENARCPNRPECYSRRTATFMILGNVCTRPCGFCSVPRGEPLELEDDEPARVAEAAARLGLRHVVITSVTRDDLADGGADHFYRTIHAVRQRTGAVVEVLTPDFLGDYAAIDRVLEARPEVYNHNMETVPRLYKKVRGRADYQRSLDLLAYVKEHSPGTVTKSGLMLGLGETTEELLDVLSDLRGIACDALTLGQYLAPTLKHIPVKRYVPPAEFDELARLARSMGFEQVASGPFVRSSYHADEMVNHDAHRSHPA
jgi:lipoic acid synthetase